MSKRHGFTAIEGLLVALVAGFVIWLVAIGIDCATAKTVTDSGSVIDRLYEPEHYTTDWHTDGKGNSYTTQTWHPAEYRIVVQTEQHGVVNMPCGQTDYAICKPGYEGSFTWRQGRFGVYSGGRNEIR